MYLSDLPSWQTLFQSTSSSRSQTFQLVHQVLDLVFQSTSSSRSQTETLTPRVRGLDYFNPLAPRGARRGTIGQDKKEGHISIH